MQSGLLIPVPVGCPVPEPAVVVFTGTMIGKDDVTQVVRFRIDQVRAGSAESWAVNGLIDVRYGPDYRFLAEGDQYLIGVGLDPVYGVPALDGSASRTDLRRQRRRRRRRPRRRLPDDR